MKLNFVACILLVLPALSSATEETESSTLLAEDVEQSDLQCGSGTESPMKLPAEENKAFVMDYLTKIFIEHDFAAIDNYLDKGYIQHNPNVADGRDAIKLIAEKQLRDKPKVLDVKRIGADGDLVWVHQKFVVFGRDSAVIDIFRVQNGKIVEHWDVIQPVPQKSANSNTMF